VTAAVERAQRPVQAVEAPGEKPLLFRSEYNSSTTFVKRESI
jgi:hypothetical protein